MSLVEETGVAPPPRATRRRTVLVAVVVLVLVGLTFAVVSWRKNPNLIGWSGEGVDPIGVPLKEAAYAMNIAQPLDPNVNETITLTSASVHLTTNTADATVTLTICVGKPGPDGTQIGGVRPSELRQYCSRVIPIHRGTKMLVDSNGPPREYIILTVIAKKPGLVKADRLRITYERGWKHLFQRGTLDEPIGIGVRANPVRPGT